ncbi:hypothetical protein VTL71DRAFT_2791 [Oculimacula yallundae]|uniref:Uncharacterized protein n=1 Tax=Oculimacula yallundae TaxID=86028 RepID=A0ABR4CA20_9HELO
MAVKDAESELARVMKETKGKRPREVEVKEEADEAYEQSMVAAESSMVKVNTTNGAQQSTEQDRVEGDMREYFLQHKERRRLRDEQEHFQGLSNFQGSQRGWDKTRESLVQQPFVIPGTSISILSPGKKKIGRPRKTDSQDASPIPKKKMGRPKKTKSQDASRIPKKKMGRPKKTESQEYSSITKRPASSNPNSEPVVTKKVPFLKHIQKSAPASKPKPRGPPVTERQLVEDIDNFRTRMALDIIAIEDAAAESARRQKAYSATIEWDYDLIPQGSLRTGGLQRQRRVSSSMHSQEHLPQDDGDMEDGG